MKKIIKLALILFVVSAVVAGVLGGVYVLTKPNIDAYATQKTIEAYSAVTEAVVDPSRTETVEGNADGITKVTPCEDGNNYVVELTVTGSQGAITMAVGVDKENAVCTGISIISSSETSGLGAEASKDYFKDQFPGMDSTNVHITKDGGQINAITGATITSRAVTNGAAAAIDYVANMG